jgi:ketosteroid isomerase-like protein
VGATGDVVRRYRAACTEGTAQDIAATLTPAAVVYDTNHAPVRGHEAIGAFWVRVRARWHGARWRIDALVEEGDAAASEWTMTGQSDGRPFAVHGSEHYRVEDGRIAEIRQYWSFDPERLDTGLVGYPYAVDGSD